LFLCQIAADLSSVITTFSRFLRQGDKRLNVIADILRNNNFDQMVSELPDEEKEEFLYDCKLVKIIPSQA